MLKRVVLSIAVLWSMVIVLVVGADSADHGASNPLPASFDPVKTAKADSARWVAMGEFYEGLRQLSVAADADRWIEWDRPAREIHNLVRGLARPYVGALTRCGGQDVVVWRTRPTEVRSSGAGPGAVVATDDWIAVETADTLLLVLDHEPGVLVPGDSLGSMS